MKYTDFEKHIKGVMQEAEIPLDTTQLLESIYGSVSPAKNVRISGKLILLALLGLFMLLSGLIFTSNKYNDSKHPDTQIAVIPTDLSDADSEDTAMNKSKTDDCKTTGVKFFGSEISTQESENNQAIAFINFVQKQHSKARKTNSTINITSRTDFMGLKNETNQADGLISTTNSIVKNEISSVASYSHSASVSQIETSLLYPASSLNSVFDYGKKKPKTGCPTFDRSDGLSFEIIPEIGYFRPLKRLSAPGTEPSDLLALRDRNESSLEGLQAALYGRMRFGSVPLYLQSGVYFTRQSERMKLDYSYTRLDTVQGIISITRSPSGDTITTIYGDIVRETTVSGQSIGHHYFSLLDIPISLGYEMEAGRFTIGVEAGLMFNIFLKSKGRLLDSPTSFQELSSNSPFKTGAGLSYFGSVNVSTRIGPGSIQLAARYRHIPNDFTIPGAQIAQGYSQAGLHLAYVIPLQRSGLKVL
jgi:hypothetical protein